MELFNKVIHLWLPEHKPNWRWDTQSIAYSRAQSFSSYTWVYILHSPLGAQTLSLGTIKLSEFHHDDNTDPQILTFKFCQIHTCYSMVPFLSQLCQSPHSKARHLGWEGHTSPGQKRSVIYWRRVLCWFVMTFKYKLFSERWSLLH